MTHLDNHTALASEDSSAVWTEKDTPSPRAERVIGAVTAFARFIAPVLEEGSISSEMFTDLKKIAEMLQEPYSAAEITEILADPEIAALKSTLPKMVSHMETELEKAEGLRQLKILEAEGPKGLEKFIFVDKYRSLVRKEWMLYQMLHSDADLRRMKFVFAGCGGMPMTPVGMAQTFGVHVDCYDVDREAYQTADRMISLLGLQDKMGVYHGNALDIDYSRYDIVVVANLAQPQMKILGNIGRYENVKAVIVRKVNGLVSLLYPCFDPEGLKAAGLEFAGQADPNDKNSVHQSVLLRRIMS